jgi:hypothetical protein
MKTEITRDLMIDLLPAYLSGDASTDTKLLVENYLKENPDFAQLIKHEAKVVFPSVPAAASNNAELAALKKTQKHLRRLGWIMGIAIFCTLLGISFQFGPEGIKWTWGFNPGIAVALEVTGALLWIWYFRGRRVTKHRIGI